MYACMYVCICMYVCMYVCMCVYVCMYVCTCVCKYVRKYPNLPWNYSSYSAFEVINDSQQQRKKFNEVWKDYLL